MNENEYFNNELGVQIWNLKYRNDNESFDDWLTRVSGGDPEVHQLIKEKKFMFGGRILANRGIEGKKLSLSNCYYIPIEEDSITAIYDAAKNQAITYSFSGGCGSDLSVLAPRGAKVNNAAKTTSGAVSFMDLFSTTAGLIGMDGRRAALLLSLKSEHPGLREFITAKSDNESIKTANLSVRASNVFMNAVIQNLPHYMSFTRHTGETIETWDDANDLMDLLVKNNYDYAEPGILYDDRMCNYNMMQYIDDFQISGVNPCGEACLPDYGACLLGSLNLSEFVVDGEFDYSEFESSVRIAVNALNDVLDEGADKHPLKEQCDVAKKWRQIGLGVMGYADALIKLGITYGSEECITFTKDIAGTMFRLALCESSDIYECVNKEGNIFTKSELAHIINSDIMNYNCSNPLKDRILRNGLRNATLLSIAPTGSISTMLGISGGIEPHYALSYTRRTESLHGEEKSYEVEIPIVEEWMSQIVDWRCETKLPDYFVTAKDIHWKERLKVQEAWQNSVDASISSTINLPEDTTEATIKRIYVEAWQRGLKGITVYRDNCSRQGVLSEGKGQEGLTASELAVKEHHEDRQEAIDMLDSGMLNIYPIDTSSETKESIDTPGVFSMGPEVDIEIVKESTGFKRGEWNQLSDDLTYIKRKIYTGCGKLTLFIGYSIENSKIEEIYIKRSGKGGCARSLDALAITMSSMLRLGGNIENIEKAFEGLEPCSSFVRERAKGNSLSSGSNCAMAMLKELQQFLWECSEDTEFDFCHSDTVSNAIEVSKEEFMLDCDCTEMTADNCTPTDSPNYLAWKNHLISGTEYRKLEPNVFKTDSTNQCPECKSELQYTGGCVSCSCGYTKCD